MPFSKQFNNLKSTLKLDAESPHRLETFPQLIAYLEQFTIKLEEDYAGRVKYTIYMYILYNKMYDMIHDMIYYMRYDMIYDMIYDISYDI